jgi:dTDP-4-dehydrorhamnose 3,5-epimerase
MENIMIIKSEIDNFEDVLIIKPTIHVDSRGWFFEAYNAKKFRGYDLKFVQDNHIYNKSRHTFRGFHYQRFPYEQSKLVRCLSGSIIDIIIDLRVESPTYLHWKSYRLDEISNYSLFIPRGFAHGYITLEDNTQVLYKVDQHYEPKSEIVIRFDQVNTFFLKSINSMSISDKDRNGLTIQEVDEILRKYNNDK